MTARWTRRDALRALAGGVGAGVVAGCGTNQPTTTSPPAPGGDPFPAEGPVAPRHAYGPGELQFGELTVPPGPGPFPVAVAVHGGFWKAAYDLTHLRSFCAAVAEGGWAVWSVEYRRVGNDGGGWPNTLLDVAAGADYVRKLAAEHPLDLTRVVSVGHSAGGHLALWLAARHRLPVGSPLFAKDPLPLAGAVSLAGVCDLRHGHRLGLGGGAVANLLGGDPDAVPDRYAAASPAELLPLGVRQVLVHGAADTTVPVVVSRAYRDAATAIGDTVELAELPAAAHFAVINPESPAWLNVTAALATFR